MWLDKINYKGKNAGITSCEVSFQISQHPTPFIISPGDNIYGIGPGV